MILSNLKSNNNTNFSQKDFFHLFRLKYPYKTLKIKNRNWQYIKSGTNGPFLVLLHGGFSNAYFYFHQIPVFEKEYCVLVPTIPAGMKSLNEIVNSLRKLIISENSHQSPVILLGISFGGIVAQVFLYQNPEMLNSVILSHTGTPQHWQQKRFLFMYYVYSILPNSIIARLARKLAINKDAVSTSKWITLNSLYFTELAETYLTKQNFLSRFQAILDFKKYELDQNIMKRWKGNMLILASEDDRLITQISRMKSYYQEAIIHIFPAGRGGHHTNLYYPEIYNEKVREFLKDNNL